jgi:hypothetical protein
VSTFKVGLPHAHRRAVANSMIELRWIPELALGSLDGAVDIAVANLLAALQGRGHLLQKLVTVTNAQRPGGAENGVKLSVAEGERAHV